MWRRSFLFCFGEWRRKNMLSYFHKKVYSRTIFLMSKFFVIWDLQLLPGPFNSLFWYEICSKSQKLSLSFFLSRLILHVLFVNMAFNKRTALTYIVFYFFILLSDKEIIFCYRLLKENDLISQTKKRESKWKYTAQMKSIAFTFIVCFSFLYPTFISLFVIT